MGTQSTLDMLRERKEARERERFERTGEITVTMPMEVTMTPFGREFLRSQGKQTVALLMFEVATTLPQPFSREALAVALFAQDSVRWGLAGYRHLVDSHRVWSALSAKSGPVAKGLLRRLGGGRYECIR